MKSSSTRKVALLKKAHVQAHLKLANKYPITQRRVGKKCCGEMRPKLSSLASTQLAVFGDREMLTMTPRTPSQQSSTEAEACFWAVSLVRVQNEFTLMRGRGTEPCPVKSWPRISSLQPEH